MSSLFLRYSKPTALAVRFQRTAACYHQHCRIRRYANENKLRFTSVLIWFVQPVKCLFIFTSATNNCIILSITLSSFVPAFPSVKQRSAAAHTVDIALLLMWIADTLPQVQLWQWGGCKRNRCVWQHLHSTARTPCSFPGKHLIRLLTALASVRVCVYVREGVQTGEASPLTYLILVNSQGWWRVCSCRRRYLLGGGGRREAGDCIRARGWVFLRGHVCVHMCLIYAMPSLLMITQTLKMIFNIQSTHGLLGVDKSSSNLIYIPIPRRTCPPPACLTTQRLECLLTEDHSALSHLHRLFLTSFSSPLSFNLFDSE